MKILRKILLPVALIININSFSQTFQVFFGDDINPTSAYDIVKTFDGGYMMGGQAYRGGMNAPLAFYFLKANENGQLQYGRAWKRTDMFEWINSIRQTPDSGFIFLGTNDTIDHSHPVPVRGPHTCALGKTNSQGQVQWLKTFSNGTTYVDQSNIELTSDGNLIILTHAVDPAVNRFILHLMKTDLSGDTIWTRCYRSGWSLAGTRMKQTADGGYILLGKASSGQNYKILLMKVTSDGSIDWYKTFAIQSTQQLRSLEVTSDGGYIMTGTVGGTDSTLASVLKTDSQGNVSWAFKYSESMPISGNSLIPTSDGGYMLTGTWIDTASNSSDMFLLKLDVAGNVQWSKRYGNTDYDGGSLILEIPGGYVASGFYRIPGHSGGDIYLVKTDINGNSGCYESALNMSSQPQSWTSDTLTFTEGVFPYTEKSFNLSLMSISDAHVLCSTVGIAENEFETAFEIFPNPSSEYLNIRTNSFSYFDVEIYDSFGRLKFKEKNYSGRELNIEDYSPGVYFVRITTKNKQELKLLIKQKHD